MVRVLDHDRSSREVAEPLAATVGEEHDHPDAVAIRQEVDDPHDVADASLHPRQRLASVADHAEPKSPLAKRLPGEQCFADPEVAEHDDEGPEREDESGGRGRLGEPGDAGREEHEGDQQSSDDEKVEDLGDPTSAQTSDLVVEGHPLRRGDNEVSVGEWLPHSVILATG